MRLSCLEVCRSYHSGEDAGKSRSRGWDVRRAAHAVRRAHERTFRSLRQPNYRRFFVGQSVSVVGTWMQRVAQDWLVLTLTGSGVALGISMALQFGPMLVLGLWGGTVVDRVDRRKLVVLTQAVQAVLAATLGLLALTGVVELWMVYVLGLALGVTTVFDSPGRQALLGEMVEPADYVNAQALNSTVHNAGRLIGPAIAGLLIATTGVGAAFLANALSFVAVLVGLLRMDPSGLRPPPTGRGPRKGQVREGLRYVRASPDLRAALLLIGVVALLGQNFRVVLPLLAQSTFDGGAEVYGYLTAALGLGAVVGALFSASRETATSWGLLVSCLAFGVVNLVAAVAPTLVAAYLAMVAVGFVNIVFNTIGRTVLLLGSDPSMHGRWSPCTEWSSSARPRSAGPCSAGSARSTAPAPASSWRASPRSRRGACCCPGCERCVHAPTRRPVRPVTSRP
jgi:MFS family permease